MNGEIYKTEYQKYTKNKKKEIKTYVFSNNDISYECTTTLLKYFEL